MRNLSKWLSLILLLILILTLEVSLPNSGADYSLLQGVSKAVYGQKMNEVQVETPGNQLVFPKSLNTNNVTLTLGSGQVPQDHTWIHGHIFKSHEDKAPLRGIVLELWNNTTHTLVLETVSSDSDDDPGAFDFGYIYTAVNDTFFVRIVAQGYNSTGYKMLDVIKEFEGSLVHYDSPEFVCSSEQDYDCELYGPNEDWNPTTIADLALHIYDYVWQVYTYFRSQLNHYIDHVTAYIIEEMSGAWGGATEIAFSPRVSGWYKRLFGHEYGHSILLQIYAPWDSCNSTQDHSHNHADRSAWGFCHHVLADPDFGTAEYPVPCSDDALSEGWANFIPWLVQDDYQYTYGSSSNRKMLDLRESAGEKNECGFAGILHNIYTIPGQNQSTMVQYIWEVISQDQPGSVNMFYDAFVTRYPELMSEVQIAFMKRFALFSKLGIEVNVTKYESNHHVNISGYLMPFPHPNKTISLYYRPVGDASWTWLADVLTNNRSFYTHTVEMPPGVYEFQCSWPGDRDHHTGHYGCVSDIIKTDEAYIGSFNGVKFYADTDTYYPGDTVRVRVVNANFTETPVSAYTRWGKCSHFPTFYNFSHVNLPLCITYPNGTIVLNTNLTLSPFYGITYANFTDTPLGGNYRIEVIDENYGPIYVGSLTIVPEFSSFLILPLFMIAILLAVMIYRMRGREHW